MSGLTKNQHFVPRLLLKNFATGADGMVQVFDSTRQVARRSSVRGVLAQNFYYDDDNAIEKFLAEEIEAPAAPVISAIIADPGRVIPRRQPALTGFLMAQLARTPGMYAEALSFVDGFTKMLLEQYAELNGLARESVSTMVSRSSRFPWIRCRGFSPSLLWQHQHSAPSARRTAASLLQRWFSH